MSWIVPLVLAVGQLAAWPGVPLARGAGPAGLPLLGAVAAVCVAMTVLAWRRSAPVPVALVLTGIATVTEVWWPEGQLLGISIAQLVAYYSVAVHRPRRTALWVGAVAVVASGIATVVGDLPGRYVLVDVIGTAVLLAPIGYAGWQRRRWRADRIAAARRLAEADENRRRAADDERHRLARELHDVAAHHLTSIVVTVGAARRLAGRRPELAAEALTFAARTGRETLAALRRLVSVMGDALDEAQPVALADLAAGFQRLGQHVETEIDATPLPPEVADAAHGIAREALTNTLRYAHGGAVRLRLRLDRDGDSDDDGGGDAVTLTVTDDGATTGKATTGPATTGLGSGRGIPGMRDRAASIGGRLDAGPVPGGGWQVRAVLPLAPAAPGRRARAPLPVGRLAADPALVLVAAGLPVLVGVAAAPPVALPVAVLLGALAVGHAVPLLWRRRFPWSMLAAVLAGPLVWAVLLATGVVPVSHGALYATAVLAEIVAVYAVARHGRPAPATWIGAFATAAAVGTVGGGGAMAGGPAHPIVTGVAAAVPTAALVLVPALLVWSTGFVPRYRRARVIKRERAALAGTVRRAEEAARAERQRISLGLRAAVVDRTDAVTAAADAGDLDGVLDLARAALAAMRDLLAGIQADTGRRDPQPTAAGIAERVRPDVVLMDVRMPGMDGLTATARLTAGADPPRVVVLTTFDQDAHVFAALRGGASGFLLKDAEPADLLTAIRVVAAGDAMLAPAITRRLIHAFTHGPAPTDTPDPRLASLTPREREVLTRIAGGLSNAEIGAALGVATGTVKAHVNTLLAKLGVRDRVQATIVAYDLGLVRPR